MRRDGTVAVVTDISDGWLLLDDDVDNSALPNEVHIVNLNCEDHIITDLALSFGIDPLKAKKVPDLARQKVSQSAYAYRALQVVAHPTIDKAYLTILSISEYGRYKVRVKPEKGSSYEQCLSEASIRTFEREGILPMVEDGQVNRKVGDVVMVGLKVLILTEDKGDDWSTVDPVTGETGTVAASANMVAQPKLISEAMKTLYDKTIANEPSKTEKDVIVSLRAENTSLHKQLDAANNLLQSNEAESGDVRKLNDTLAQVRDELASTKSALTLKSDLYDDLEDDYLTLKEKVASGTVQMPTSSMKPYECKIMQNTGEDEFERLWADGWTCYHVDFNDYGKVRSVWKKFNRFEQDMSAPYDEQSVDASEINTNKLFDAALYDGIPVPEEILVTVPAVKTPPANKVTLGRYGTALATHGVEKVKEAMDAEVQLAVLEATDGYEAPPIAQFLPSPDEVNHDN
jgi:hypothetical protein